jgi:hypothetical protein
VLPDIAGQHRKHQVVGIDIPIDDLVQGDAGGVALLSPPMTAVVRRLLRKLCLYGHATSRDVVRSLGSAHHTVKRSERVRTVPIGVLVVDPYVVIDEIPELRLLVPPQ